jgi:hypothetical protein
MVKLSEKKYKVKLVKNVMIPMRDGVHLAADLMMPDSKGKFPGLILYWPYRKDDIIAPRGDSLYYFAERGYVGVSLDVRGTGSSEGYSTEEYSAEEIQDAQDAIHWLAKQEWCTGKLGMFGWSYSGQTTMIAAMNAPEPLKAVICALFSDDRYKADCHYVGGSLMPLVDYCLYGPFMLARNVMPPYPEYSGEEWLNLWKERLERSRPWTSAWLEHQLDEDYWHPGSVRYYYDKVKAATFLIDGWRDGYPGAALRMYENLKCPKRILIGPWLHGRPDSVPPGPNIDIHHEMLRWWDYWLKGIDTGIKNEPPVSLYIQKYDPPSAMREATTGFWRYEREWPITRRKEKTLYLHPDGQLSNEACKTGGHEKDSYEYKPHVGIYGGIFSATLPHILPLDQRSDEAFSLNYTTPPLKNDLEVTGFPKAVLYASSTATIASFVVRLSDVSPDGTSSLVTKGALNATRRNSFKKPEPLAPGKVYELIIDLNATSWLFEKGHKIRVSVSSSDWPNMWPTPDNATNSVYRSTSQPSMISLPVISARKEKFPAPTYPAPIQLPKPVNTSEGTIECSIVHNLYKRQVSLRTKVPGRLSLRDLDVEIEDERNTEAGISTENPSEAFVNGSNKIRIRRKDYTIDIIGEDTLTSTHDNFHLLINVGITLNGVPYFSKNWTTITKRNLS